MTLRQSLIILTSSIMALTLGACSTVKEHSNTLKTAKIMKERNAQIAVALNKDLSLDVLGVRAGKRVKETCGKDNVKGNAGDCQFDPDDIFAQKTITITIVKGTCCAYIGGASSGTEYCSPPEPIEFINTITGEICTNEKHVD
jgi:hypothetical protein